MLTLIILSCFKYFYQTLRIQVLLLIVCTIMGFKYSKWLHSSVWAIDWTLAGTTTQDPIGPWSNGNEGVLHYPWNSRIKSDHFMA